MNVAQLDNTEYTSSIAPKYYVLNILPNTFCCFGSFCMQAKNLEKLRAVERKIGKRIFLLRKLPEQENENITGKTLRTVSVEQREAICYVAFFAFYFRATVFLFSMTHYF